jgi:hypothetical protein
MFVEANAALGRKFFEEQDRVRGGPASELCAPNDSAWPAIAVTHVTGGRVTELRAVFDQMGLMQRLGA